MKTRGRKYYIEISHHGRVVWFHCSDNAMTLIKRIRRECRDQSGAYYQWYHFGTMRTNVPDEAFESCEYIGAWPS